MTADLFNSSLAMSRIIRTIKWIGKNPKKSLVFGLILAYGFDYGRDKYL